jgi:hypothetical protein
MPIVDLGSYIVTGQAFEAHWSDVNVDRVANTLPELALPDGFVLGNLSTDITALQASMSVVDDLINGQSLATAARDTLRTSLRERVIEFREAVNYRLKDSGYARALPDTPQAGASEQKLLKALDDMQSVWTRVDAATGVPNFTAPLLLRNNIALSDFTTELSTLRTAFIGVTDAGNDLKIARSQRDVLLDPLRGRMVEYRQAVQVEYGDGHPFVTSLPDVSSSSTGSTPDAVTASGTWDEETLEAVLTWSASSNSNLSHYEIRVSPGASYDSASASVAGQTQPGTEEFHTTQELLSPGDVASFKVYVILTTGNISGSNTVTITNPEES